MINSNFKQNIIKYVNLDDKIREKEHELRKLRKYKESTSTDIIDYIIKNKIYESDIKIGNSKLRYQETKTKTGLGLNVIKMKLRDYFKDKYHHLGNEKCEKFADDIFNYISNSRKTKTKIVLKRIFNKP